MKKIIFILMSLTMQFCCGQSFSDATGKTNNFFQAPPKKYQAEQLLNARKEQIETLIWNAKSENLEVNKIQPLQNTSIPGLMNEIQLEKYSSNENDRIIQLLVNLTKKQTEALEKLNEKLLRVEAKINSIEKLSRK